VNPTLASLQFAESSGVDVLIATGYEAGGHMTRHKISLLSLFQEAHNKIKMPLVAGGGICIEAGARAAAAMGDEGVYVGTRLIVTEENPASDVTKQAIIAARAEDLIEFRAQIGYLRTTRSKVSKECEKLSNEGADGKTIAAVYQDIWRASMLLGDLDKGFLSVSDAINSITDMKTCKEVVDELASVLISMEM